MAPSIVNNALNELFVYVLNAKYLLDRKFDSPAHIKTYYVIQRYGYRIKQQQKTHAYKKQFKLQENNCLPCNFFSRATKTCTRPKYTRCNRARSVSIEFFCNYVNSNIAKLLFQFYCGCKANNACTQHGYI